MTEEAPIKKEENPKVVTPSISKIDIWKFIINYGIVVAVLVGYGFFVKYLLTCIETDEPYWSRMILLFSSIEAIAFGALGYVFGKEITKKIAKTAEEGKNEAKKEAEKAKKEQKKVEGKIKEKDDKLKSITNKLIALREAVIVESKVSKEKFSQFSQVIEEFSPQKTFNKSKFEESEPSRALELALDLKDLETGELTIDFDYEIKGLTEDEFEYVSINGDERDELSGKYYGIPAPGRRVRVEVKRRGNNKTWVFNASSIEDQEGYEMEMTNSLKASSNSGYFKVKYK